MLSWAIRASACPRGGLILGCVLAPCALGPVLLDSRSWLCSRLFPELPPSPSELLLVTQPPQGAAT